VGKKHDLIALIMRDPREEEIPPMGLVKLQDSETGQEFWLDTFDSKIRDQYRQIVNEKRRSLKQILNSCDADKVELHADQDYVRPLSRFFRMRARRR